MHRKRELDITVMTIDRAVRAMEYNNVESLILLTRHRYDELM